MSSPDTIAASTTLAKDRADAGESLPTGAALGRYVILDRLGAGGMGVVYSAYDPQLDRRVALKVIGGTVTASARASARLVREAQAMAKLTHPNVISVFDAGVDRDRVFVAMELVDGETLAAWLHGAGRSTDWRTKVDRLRRAGEGLAAAHRAGIIHRDFKPDNVMLARDGRVIVMDFGLASTVCPSGDASDERHASELPSGPALTAAGALIGTPAYMAPEQFAGAAVDERSDQFGFCVSLYEALYGDRPFRGKSVVELAASVTSGELRAAPDDAKVPGWLRRVVMRGLSTDPASRHPSMDALLAAIAADPGRRWRRWIVRGVFVGALGFAGWSALHRGTSTPAPCGGSEALLVGVWDEDRRAAIGAAIVEVELSHLSESGRSAAETLDAYAATWVEMRRDACEATHIRDEQSEALLDLRMRCLQRRRVELATVVDLLTDPDPASLEHGLQGAWSLTPVADCADVEQLTATVPLPTDPQVRTRIAAAEDAIAKATGYERAARYDEGLRIVTDALTDARATNHAPLIAEAHYRMGRFLERTGKAAEARDVYMAAVQAASQGHHDEIVAMSYADMAFVVGHAMAKPDEGLILADVADAAIVRVGSPAILIGKIANTRGAIFDRAGQYQQALAGFERALEVWQPALGADDPRVASVLGNVGAMRYRLGRYDEALEHYRSGLSILERVHGPEHPAVAKQLANVGLALKLLGRLEEAMPPIERALAIRERALGMNHPETAASLAALAGVLRSLHRNDEALAAFMRALAIQEATFGSDHADVAATLTNMGSLLHAMHRYDEAIASHERALVITEAKLGAEHPQLGYIHHSLGTALVAAGRTPEAVPHLERALAIHEQHTRDRTIVGHTKFALAGALWALDREHERALALARDAEAAFASAPSGEEARSTVATWLRMHAREE